MTSPPAATGRPHDAAHFRQVLGQYPTGVSIVTALDSDGAPQGMVVGSFTSVSLDPPLVAFLPSATSKSYAQIRPAGRFCVNILAADQESLCEVFTSRGVDKFAQVAWHTSPTGTPVLDDAVAWIDCETEVIHQAGDHDIVVGRVLDLDVHSPGAPLLFFQGGYGSFSPHSLMLRDARFTAQLRLVDQARPYMEAVAARTGSQVVATHCDGTELTLLATAGAPTRPGTRSEAAIGRRLPVKAPIGIWWMAFADEPDVRAYTSGLKPDARERCHEVMAQIRERGFSLGLSSVQNQIGEVLNQSTRDGRSQERHISAFSRMAFDPGDYDLSRVPSDAPVRDAPDVVSLWAPSFDQEGHTSLGFMLAGFDADAPLQALADALLGLTRDVTRLAAC